MHRVLGLLVALLYPAVLAAQPSEVRIVRPAEIDDLLVNPGIGFTTFQRFNGDALNERMGWTEGRPIEYQAFDGDLTNPDHPMTSLAYFRVNWRFLEPEPREYDWGMIDRALRTAAERGQSLILRKLTYPARVRPHGALSFTSWWENKGVAPCYRDFQLALRLVGEGRTEVLVTEADIPSWLPGDALYDDRVFLPADLPEGDYELQLGIVDRQTRKPRVRLAIEGRSDEGWYPMGTITVQDGPYPVGVERDLDTP